MYTGLLHTHRLVVLIFLVIYLVKLGLMFFHASGLERVRANKAARITEMIVSVLFLLTGIGLLVNSSEPTAPMLLGKIVVVLASIPLAVVGFKKGNKILASLSVVLLIAAYGMGEMHKAQKGKVVVGEDIVSGIEIYKQANCNTCHGDAGDAGVSGAKNLQTSTLSTAEITNIIKNGKNAMPAYKHLSEGQLKELTQYVESLKK
jgi:uncharacterized membrane protein SirB2